MTLVSRTPGADICDVARVKGAALIVMGWHKPVFNQAVLGGTVQQVMKSSAADVAVFIDRGISFPLRRILLPYTGTVHDRAALTLAARLARRFDAQVTLLHVVRPGRASASCGTRGTECTKPGVSRTSRWEHAAGGQGVLSPRGNCPSRGRRV